MGLDKDIVGGMAREFAKLAAVQIKTVTKDDIYGSDTYGVRKWLPDNHISKRPPKTEYSYRVALVDGKPAAYAAYQNKDKTLASLYVRGPYRRKGIGSKLMDEFDIRKLRVMRQNLKAQGLYRKKGLEVVDEKRKKRWPSLRMEKNHLVGKVSARS